MYLLSNSNIYKFTLQNFPMKNNEKIVEGFNQKLTLEQIADYAGVSISTAVIHLRSLGLIKKRRDRELVEKLAGEYAQGKRQHEVSKKFKISPSKTSIILKEEGLVVDDRCILKEEERESRIKFLSDLGLEKCLSGFGIAKSVADREVMKDSYDFFESIGANPIKIFKKYPLFLTFGRKKTLEPKLYFLENEMGILRKRIAKLPRLFTRSIDYFKNFYNHYLITFGDELKVKNMIKSTPNLFNYNTKKIDQKIQVYNEVGINFHKNYVLLLIDPNNAIEARDYLKEELKIKEPGESAIWFYMILTSKKTYLESKVRYCEKEGINWMLAPKVLVLGLGTEEKPGALVRRVGMIKNAFGDRELPWNLNYKENPLVLERPDGEIIEKIENYFKRTSNFLNLVCPAISSSQ